MSDVRTDGGRADRRNADSVLMAETLRSADLAGRATDERPATPKRTKEDGMSMFWQVFGGTILSIVALVFITLYNHVASSVTELRAEVVRMNEAKGEFAKKDDVNAVRVLVTSHAGYRAEIDSLKERMSKSRLELDEARKALTAALDAQKKEEGVALDGLKKDLAGTELTKERVLSLTAELKATREELVKVRGDVEKNQAADNERRDLRTVQMKQLEDLVKEQAKAVQETREKLARLEGQQTPPKPAEVGPAAPPTKAKTAPPPDDK